MNQAFALSNDGVCRPEICFSGNDVLLARSTVPSRGFKLGGKMEDYKREKKQAV